MLNGYDISNNQGDINNTLVPGDFAIIKASEGVGYTDPNCDANYQQAKAAGKLLGVYHFARPDGNDPISEANWFVSQIRGYVGEANLILDLEVQPITPQWAKSFLDRVHELTGVRGWLYASQSVLNNGDWSALWPDYAAWVACYGMNNQQNGYGSPAAEVSLTGNWTIIAWQYTSRGILPGWGGNLDLNIFYGNVDTWRKYANPSAPTPTSPVVRPVVPQPAPTEPVIPPTAVVEPIPTPVVTEPTSVPDVLPPITEPTPIVVQKSWLAVFIDFLFKLLRLRK